MEIHTLTPSELEKYNIIRSCIDRDITNKQAAIQLGLQVRQVQNLKRKVEEEGKTGIIHGLRGTTSHRATKQTVIKEVKRFFKQKKHQDFGPTFAGEKLKTQGIVVGTETLRQLMISLDMWKSRKRSGPKIHREWRERMGSFGEMVQFDGSYHDWFEHGKEVCLLAAIDDATGDIVKAVFEDNEGVLACFRFWRCYVETKGRPLAIYLDKFGTYKINHKSATDNADLMTQFGRAMKELDIRVIHAHSPEGKGRVERLFGTLQDRLVKEMRLVDIKNPRDANVFLKEVYIPDHRQRFSVKARTDIDMHRPLTDNMRKNLSAIFSIQSTRRVNNDFTIQFKTKWFQLEATQKTVVYKRDVVTVEEREDGNIHIRLKKIYLEYRVLPERPVRRRIHPPALTPRKPSKDHPWRKFEF